MASHPSGVWTALHNLVSSAELLMVILLVWMQSKGASVSIMHKPQKHQRQKLGTSHASEKKMQHFCQLIYHSLNPKGVFFFLLVLLGQLIAAFSFTPFSLNLINWTTMQILLKSIKLSITLLKDLHWTAAHHSLQMKGSQEYTYKQGSREGP